MVCEPVRVAGHKDPTCAKLEYSQYLINPIYPPVNPVYPLPVGFLLGPTLCRSQQPGPHREAEP